MKQASEYEYEYVFIISYMEVTSENSLCEYPVITGVITWCKARDVALFENPVRSSNIRSAGGITRVKGQDTRHKVNGVSRVDKFGFP